MSQQTQRAANRIELKLQQKKVMYDQRKEESLKREQLSQAEVMLTAAIEVELAVLRLR
jgi:hypothetical protein